MLPKKNTAAGLKWSPVECEDSAFLGDMKGFISLEEIDGIDVEYADSATGAKTVAFKPLSEGKSANSLKRSLPAGDQSSKKKSKPVNKALPKKESSEVITSNKNTNNGWIVADKEVHPQSVANKMESSSKGKLGTKTKTPKSKPASTTKEPEVAMPNQSVDMTAWTDLELHPTLLNNLKKLGFSNPTPIQRAVLPIALQNRDIVAAAETGSGKTLAFGLSIAQHLLNHPDELNNPNRPLLSLIISPTRELAIQIRDHISRIISDTPIQITAIVGGLAREKQERLLLKRPHIVVGTPGRLYELITQETGFLKDLSGIQCFIIDEADRMIQQGHFKELQSILSLLPSMTKRNQMLPEETKAEMNLIKRQTMLFSATLTLNEKLQNKKLPSMNNLLRKIDFKDKIPEIIDLTKESMLPKGISESQLHCLQRDKDDYLYYFLLKYPGRTLVFLNSIDAIRRLLPLLRLLNLPVHPLHAQLQQKQRLKNVERFKSIKNVVLLATDVAARGLDIDDIQHIVHFQVPKNVDTYIHRSGRTARGLNVSGMSLLLVGPEEISSYRKLLNGLGKSTMPEFQLSMQHMKQIKERTTLARNIDLEEHSMRKKKTEGDWLKKAAAAMELDQEELSEEEDSQLSRKSSRSVGVMKSRLDGLLKKSIIPRGTSLEYPASHPTTNLPSLFKSPQYGGLLSLEDLSSN